MSKVKLTYFPARGLSEGIRLMLAATGVEWDEEHVTTKERVDNLCKEGKLLFQQFPLLEIDGLQIVQSQAAVRYLASKHDMMGKTPEENVKIDMLVFGAKDWLALGGFTGLAFQEPEKQEEVKAASLDKSRTRYLPVYEKTLKENSAGGYLVGDKLTLADIVFLDVLTWVWEYDEDLVKEFPAVTDYYKRVTSLPRLKNYLEGPRRHAHPDKEYAKMIKYILYGIELK